MFCTYQFLQCDVISELRYEQLQYFGYKIFLLRKQTIFRENEYEEYEVETSFRLRLHGIGYVQIRLGSDPLW